MSDDNSTNVREVCSMLLDLCGSSTQLSPGDYSCTKCPSIFSNLEHNSEINDACVKVANEIKGLVYAVYFNVHYTRTLYTYTIYIT